MTKGATCASGWQRVSSGSPHWEKWGLEGEYQSAKRVRFLNNKQDFFKQMDFELK